MSVPCKVVPVRTCFCDSALLEHQEQKQSNAEMRSNPDLRLSSGELSRSAVYDSFAKHGVN